MRHPTQKDAIHTPPQLRRTLCSLTCSLLLLPSSHSSLTTSFIRTAHTSTHPNPTPFTHLKTHIFLFLTCGMFPRLASSRVSSSHIRKRCIPSYAFRSSSSSFGPLLFIFHSMQRTNELAVHISVLYDTLHGHPAQYYVNVMTIVVSLSFSWELSLTHLSICSSPSANCGYLDSCGYAYAYAYG